MAHWDDYPDEYRDREVRAIRRAAEAGDCVAVVGASGAGKSNLLGFLAQRAPAGPVRYVLVDGNRLVDANTAGYLRLLAHSLEPEAGRDGAALDGLEKTVARHLAATGGKLCFLLDLSTLTNRAGMPLRLEWAGLFGNLRAVRDAFKYRLSYVAATRHPLPADNELAELFFGRVVVLGPLTAADAAWTVARYAGRQGLDWPPETAEALVALTGGYAALLRAACEAHAEGAPVTLDGLAGHPAVARRAAEFWSDAPDETELRAAGLADIELLRRFGPRPVDTAQLTAKEHLLLNYLAARPEQVCEKDELVKAVWPEDRIYERGVRDDSLAQLVRRLREKIELDPARPRLVLTVPGRGYRYRSPAPTG